MTEIRETRLPGVGLRYDFDCQSGARVAVVSHRTGKRDLVIYDRDDPDAASDVLDLTTEEAASLADLLGGSTVTARIDDLRQEIAGLAIDWITIPEGWPAAGRTIADLRVRTETGVSIVALIRERTAVPAPGPDQTLHAKDVAVAVGTPEGLAQAAKLLS